MADIIFSGASTNPVATQQYVITKSGLQALAAATVTKITGPTAIQGGKSIIVYTGNGVATTIGVGSAISLPDNHNGQAKGTARLKVDGSNIDIPVQGLSTTDIGSSSTPWTNGYITNLYGTNVGSSSTPFTNGYITNLYGTNAGSASAPFTNGYFTNLIVNGNTINTTNLNVAINGSSDTNKVFWRGDATWSNELKGPMIISSATGANGNTIPTNTAPASNAGADFRCTGAGYFGRNLTAAKVFNAVFNDYAEYRTTINLAPGHVVIDQDDGSLACSSARLQPGAQVISDTFGHSMGQTLEATTPVAVAGRVLVYSYQARENYHAGMAVCSAPGGTVDIMTREEIRDYPDCIVGIVSEIPQYETWGSDNVKVDGRIWIRVK